MSGQIFVFRTYPTPAPRSSHHRPQKKSPLPSTPGPPPPRILTRHRRKQLGEKRDRRESQPAGGHNVDNITAKQLHVGPTHDHVEKKFNGLLLLVTLAEKKQPLPTSVLMSDSPEKMTGVSFPTRCSTQLAEVYSYSGRCPSPWFRSFLCPQSS